MFKKLVIWFKAQAQKKYILPLLGFFSFIESIIFPIPVDIFVLSLSTLAPNRWKKIATVSTVFSVLGALGAYALGYYFFESFGEGIISFFAFEDEFLKVQSMFDRGVFLVMFVSAFTPIPYKVFTLTGGFLKVSLFPFVIASILGRGLRFGLEAYLPYRYGELLSKKIVKYINYIGLGLALSALFIFFL